MKKIYTISVLLLAVLCAAQAQTPSISIYTAGDACLGSVQKIPVSISGTFNPDNQFSVQVKRIESSTILAELPATLKDGQIEVTHRDSLLSTYQNIQLRVLASSPKTESQWYHFRLFAKGTLHLEASLSDTLNAGDDLPIKFTTQSTSNVLVSLSNGSQFSFYPHGQPPFVSYQQIVVTSNEPIYITKAENACGTMQTSGQVKPVLNPTAVRTTFISPAAFCEGSEVKVAFSTSGPPLSPQARYRLRFRETSYSSSSVPRTVEVNAELRDNVLVARFPTTFNLQYSLPFNVQVLVDNLGIVGSAGTPTCYIHPKPTAEIVTSSVTVSMGNQVSVGVRFNGLPPYSADLGHGLLISSAYSSSEYVYFNAEQSASYSLQSFTSGCGPATTTTPQTMVVTVQPGLLVEPSAMPQVLCVGSTSRIRLKTNATLGAATQYTVHFPFSDQKQYSFPATRQGDYLEFTIPPLPEGTDYAQTYDLLYSLIVTTTNPSLTSPPANGFTVQSMPKATLADYSRLNYDAPGKINLTYIFSGRGPFQIEEQNGQIIRQDWGVWTPDYYLLQTTDYRLKSVSNACFKNENLPSVRVTLTNTDKPGLYLVPPPKTVCAQDSIELVVKTSGTFAADNIFSVQAYTDCCTYQTLRTVKEGGTYKIKLPASSSNGSTYASIRVTSTNPVLFSETYSIEAQRPVSQASISPYGTAEYPSEYLAKDDVQLYFSVPSGSLTSAVYSDGTTDYTYTYQWQYSSYIPVKPAVGKTTAYTLKSVTNSCGTTSINATTYVRVLPYRLNVYDGSSSRYYCQNSPLIVPFAVLYGSAGNATFSLQLNRDGTNDCMTLASGETSRQFTTRIPATLEPGTYWLRITSSDGAVSNQFQVFIGALPTATLTSTKPAPIIVDANEGFYLQTTLTGSGPWTVLYEDNTRTTPYSNPESRYVIPTKAQEYYVKSVYNQCGYGTTSGRVAVQVRPRLVVSSDRYLVCEGSSFTMNYQLLGDVELSTDYIRFELVDLTTRKVLVLDSTQVLSGQRVLTIPAVLSGSNYAIRGTLRSYSLSSQLSVGIGTKADISLSGGTVINSGESTFLTLKSNKPSSEFLQYRLSDGTTGTFHGASAEPVVRVSPTQTTTYTLTSVTNSCGEGRVSGRATVEVNPPSERAITTTKVDFRATASFCPGDTVVVHYTQRGTFSAGNALTVQLSDTSGRSFRSIATLGSTSPLRAVIPSDLSSGQVYRLRVAASDPNTASGAYAYPIPASQKARARFASETVYYDGVSTPRIVVLLEGGGPWQYRFGTDLATQNRYSYTPTDTIALQQASPSQYYRLFQVTNQCGAGIVETPNTVRVEVITSTPTEVLRSVTVAPNPTQDYLVLTFDAPQPRTIRLLTLQGTLVRSLTSREPEEYLDLRTLPGGMYLLHIESQGKVMTYKVVKQ
ncbi:hypothetical protein GCM10027275_07230 [Rhabdobacter roseus]|uniref:Secretion system C-terminal sorting domain-containing protein n=1 Tax=Rhabdobacter roseus TaxID=1655419 RepID=A0A840TRG5_9BACT|nr:T9SS type A sorting domain-containing protein [Rhabdobacter roseus]MBB5282620.1 hypothetical protein [Rhabdobacter roseus]